MNKLENTFLNELEKISDSQERIQPVNAQELFTTVKAQEFALKICSLVYEDVRVPADGQDFKEAWLGSVALRAPLLAIMSDGSKQLLFAVYEGYKQSQKATHFLIPTNEEPKFFKYVKGAQQLYPLSEALNNYYRQTNLLPQGILDDSSEQIAGFSNYINVASNFEGLTKIDDFNDADELITEFSKIPNIYNNLRNPDLGGVACSSRDDTVKAISQYLEFNNLEDLSKKPLSSEGENDGSTLSGLSKERRERLLTIIESEVDLMEVGTLLEINSKDLDSYLSEDGSFIIEANFFLDTFKNLNENEGFVIHKVDSSEYVVRVTKFNK